MTNEKYAEMIEAYKTNVANAFEDHRRGLMHPNPTVVMQATLQVQNAVSNAGGIVSRLQREGYDNCTFYRTVGLVSNQLYLAAMDVECGGLHPRFIESLERTIAKIEPDASDAEFEGARREVLKH